MKCVTDILASASSFTSSCETLALSGASCATWASSPANLAAIKLSSGTVASARDSVAAETCRAYHVCKGTRNSIDDRETTDEASAMDTRLLRMTFRNFAARTSAQTSTMSTRNLRFILECMGICRGTTGTGTSLAEVADVGESGADSLEWLECQFARIATPLGCRRSASGD